MAKTKKVQMPAGIRNKLMAAVAMLLVSSIMMVSSTYAWFTLSTAPEVTGITTSVGANGNLEMALLTTDTFNNLSTIASAVGNSSAVDEVTDANITWGNLVDLSDASYGLQNISLQPARLNLNFEGGYKNVLASSTSLLQMPVYGKDGRVASLSSDTYSTTYTSTGWSFNASNQQYGVRAIGANDNLSPQQAGLIAAKVAYSNNLSSAKGTVQGALSANGNALASALTALTIDSTSELTAEQNAAIGSLISASATSLSYIDAAYKQALLAYVANQVSDTTLYATAVSTVNDAASFSAAVAALEALADVDVDAPAELNTAVANLATQQANVADAQDAYALGTAEGYKEALSYLVNTEDVTINGYGSDELMVDDDNNPDTEKVVNSNFMTDVLNDGGAIVEMPTGSGVFAYIGSVAGNYSANCTVDLTQPVTMNGLKATMKTTATVDATVSTAMNSIQAAASSGDADTVLSDVFGYALDFAFRTNAAESYLLLQTEGAQRVYSDSTSAATQGAGSTMTFQVSTTDAGTPTLTNDQVTSLMGAIRVAFFNPGTNEVYAVAALTDIAASSEGFTGDLYLHDYAIGVPSGAMLLNGVKTEGPDDGVDPSAIVKLDQSVATRVSVVVWLDGDVVGNDDVANAANSLVGSMNLQFSSSAELVPMQNTALQNMTITYAELSDDNYKAGLYSYGGTLYALNSGYKVYNGSDNTVYFSNDETNYTKLTVMNATTAMTPVTASLTGNGTMEVNGSTALTLAVSAGAIESVDWAVSPETGVASVTGNTTGATVTGIGAGTAKVTATVTLKFTTDAATVTQNVSVEFNVTVTEPVVEEEEPAAPTTYNLSVSAGVNGDDAPTNDEVAANTAYTFTINDGYTLSTVTVGGNPVTPNDNGDGSYTIPADAVTGDIEITATANP